VPDFTLHFLVLIFLEGKLDGVPGLEPGNDRIKIYCLTNLAIPQQIIGNQKLDNNPIKIKKFSEVA
jgi:hypothetical protein